jgi:hypothetical protein
MGFNKKVLSKAVSELDKAKAPAKPRDIITDPAGQWKYPGQKTRIPGSSITMQGVDYPVWAQPNVGPGSMMQPGQDYEFPDADYVDETPMARKGGTLKSHRYSKSMSATNRLFTKNKLFQNKKSKIFDPNAKFKSGGSKLGPINLNPNPLSHYELNYGFNLPTKEDGGENEDEYMDLTDEEIQAYKEAGYEVDEEPEYEIGGYVQHELVKAQKGKTVKPLEISDPKEFALRKAAYDDSLKLYNESIDDLKGMSNTKFIKAGKYTNETPQAGWSQSYINSKKDDLGNTVKGKIKPIGVNYSTRNSDNEDVVSYMYKKPVQPVKFVPKSNKSTKSEKILDINGDEVPTDYLKKHPPIYLSDPKDVKIGTYSAAGNIYAYKPKSTVKVNVPKAKTESKKVDLLPLKPIERFASSEQTIIPARPYVKAVKPSANKGVWSGGSEEQFPTGLNTSDWERKTREYQEKQRGNRPIAKAQTGGTSKDNYQINPETFNYEGRPGARYRKDNSGNWLVADKSTDGKFVAVKDSTGKRQAELNKKAISSETGKNVYVPKNAQKRFEQEIWNDYDKLSMPEKVLDRVQAGMTDPLGMTSRFLTGKQAYIPGMGKGLLNTDSENYEKYLKSVGYTPGKFEVSDVQNLLNPMSWGASAGNQLSKGNTGQGLLETGLALAGTGQSKNMIKGAKYLMDDVTKGSKYLGKTLGTETGLISNVDKYNPLAFKPKPKATKIFKAQETKLNKNLEPYLSKRIVSPTKEEQVYESFLSNEAMGKKQAERTLMYDRNGNIINKSEIELPGSPNSTPVRSGLGGMDMSKYEIKNPDYYTQLLGTYDSKVLSPTNKKFYKDLIGSIKNQNGLVTERQLNELQRLKSGNFNFGKKGYQEGGVTEAWEDELDEDEIEELRRGGYIVEDLD